MNKKSLLLAAGLSLALVLTGCSDTEDNTKGVDINSIQLEDIQLSEEWFNTITLKGIGGNPYESIQYNNGHFVLTYNPAKDEQLSEEEKQGNIVESVAVITFVEVGEEGEIHFQNNDGIHIIFEKTPQNTLIDQIGLEYEIVKR